LVQLLRLTSAARDVVTSSTVSPKLKPTTKMFSAVQMERSTVKRSTVRILASRPLDRSAGGIPPFDRYNRTSSLGGIYVSKKYSVVD
jgi:hypothetical protein